MYQSETIWNKQRLNEKSKQKQKCNVILWPSKRIVESNFPNNTRELINNFNCSPHLFCHVSCNYAFTYSIVRMRGLHTAKQWKLFIVKRYSPTKFWKKKVSSLLQTIFILLFIGKKFYFFFSLSLSLFPVFLPSFSLFLSPYHSGYGWLWFPSIFCVYTMIFFSASSPICYGNFK